MAGGKKGTNNLCAGIRLDNGTQIHKKVFFKHLLDIQPLGKKQKQRENQLQQIQFPQNINYLSNET